MDKKLYAERDVVQLDEAGNYYSRNVSRMTTEGLHAKSDIAAELGYRDKRIAELTAHVSRLREALNNIRCECEVTRWIEVLCEAALIETPAQSLRGIEVETIDDFCGFVLNEYSVSLLDARLAYIRKRGEE